MRKGVQKIYSEVVGTYELVNHVLTFGLDIYWRRKAARMAALGGGTRWLDICSGTGEMALYLSRLSHKDKVLIAADFSFPMLARAKQKKYASKIHLISTDAATLPFPEDAFDLVTISFATRNLNVRRDILLSHVREIYRILKPGGRFVNLETSQPHSRILRMFFHLYIKGTVQTVGPFLSGSKVGYRYLAYTIPRFYSAYEFTSIIREAGFSHIEWRTFLSGVAAIHISKK